MTPRDIAIEEARKRLLEDPNNLERAWTYWRELGSVDNDVRSGRPAYVSAEVRGALRRAHDCADLSDAEVLAWVLHCVEEPR